MAVGALQPVEVATLTEPNAGYEEAHTAFLRLSGRTHAENQERDRRNHR